MVNRKYIYVIASTLTSGIFAAIPVPGALPQLSPDVVSEQSAFIQSPTSVVIPAQDGQFQAVSTQQQVPAQVVQATTAAGGQEEASIYLNFDNASLASVVNYLGEQKKVNIIPHKDLENAKVTLSMRNPLTLERAWDVMLTLLEANGFSLVKVGDIYRVVPSQVNGQEPLPTYSSKAGIEPEDLPESDIVIRYVYFFKNIKTDTAKSILGRMIDEKNIVDNKDLNVCIIKDQALNIKAAMKIVKELDNIGMREALKIIPLKWASADNITKLFGDIFGTDKPDDRIIRFSPMQQKESAYFATSTKIFAEPIKNSLILLGQQKNVDKIEQFVIKHLDVPIEDAECRLHIKELSYVRAQDVKPILDDVLKPPKGASDKGLILEGGYKAFEDVIISAEQDDGGGDAAKRGGGNRLIVACNRDDWVRVEDFVDKIDKPQPQVAIEVMIIDVGNGQTRALGTQLYNIKGNPLSRNVNIEFDNLNAGGVASSSTEGSTKPSYSINQPFINIADGDPDNATWMTLGKSGLPGAENIWALIKSVIHVDNVQIISQPYVIANNNQKCTVLSSTKKKVPGKMDTKNIQAVRQKDEIEAKVSVELTPYINLNGIVDLTVNVTVEEFVLASTNDVPNRNSRALTTKASMAAGEVLVLGGLTSSNISEELHSTPLLSWIPIIGTFFKGKRKDKQERNLYIFIRPSIIKPRFEGNPDEYTQLKLDYAKFQIMKNDTYGSDHDPIQRWFFRPSHQSMKDKIQDVAKGILRPVDNFTYGRQRPRMTSIQDDPYFKSSEALAKKKRMAPMAKPAVQSTAETILA